MRFFTKLRMSGLFVAALMLAGGRAGAQSHFGLLVTGPASSLMVSNNLTYTINVTNVVGVLPNATVSNTLPASVQFVSATRSQGVVTNNGNVTVFYLGGFNVGGIARLTLTVKPTAVGFITNQVLVSTIYATNTTATNFVTQITNLVIHADLGVAITVPAAVTIIGDTMTYGVTVTNSGPDAAPNVALTNTLPPGVVLKSVSPTSPAYTAVSNNLIFSLGTLASHVAQKFQFTVQPTNAGTLDCFAAVGAPGVIDTNTANNTASNNFAVINYLPGDLVAVTNSAQIINPQNGLIEQSILVSNGTNDVPAVRLVVTGLTNRLANAVATNSGSPFVVYAAPLAAGSNVTLLLQYAPRKNFPFTNSQLHAYAVPLPDLTPPVAASAGTNVNITRIVMLTNGNPLIEFPSVLGRTYTIVYSDNLLFSNALIAPPSIVAPANQVHWIDYGPPTTVSPPASSGSRFYRVYLNP